MKYWDKLQDPKLWLPKEYLKISEMPIKQPEIRKGGYFC